MKVFYLTVLQIVFILTSPKAQYIEYLNANNVNAGFGIGGNLFVYSIGDSNINNNNSLWAQFEIPKNSGVSSIYTSALWMQGYDDTGSIYCAAQRYMQGGRDYYDGPIAANYTADYDTFYKRVFKVTKAQIDYHRNLTFPIPKNAVDVDLLKWPAMGNPYILSTYNVPVDHELAPFVDTDGDGVYSPWKGDYPAICGEEAVFFVFNDERGSHSETNGTKRFSFEIRCLAYCFLRTGIGHKDPVNNAVFVSYEIQNMSPRNYNSFYVGQFTDTDLGNFGNDRVGCDSTLNLQYVYNGTLNDQANQGVPGYGLLPIAQGVKSLNFALSSFTYFTNGNLPFLAGAMNPGECEGMLHALQGEWSDTIPFTLGGIGYGGTIPTKYIFPSNPSDTTGWSEITVAGILQAGDRRVLSGSGPYTFNAGEIKRFDMVFFSSYDTASNYLLVVDTLERDAQVLQNFYDSEILSCRGGMQGINYKNNREPVVSIFPNPTNTLLSINSEQSISTLILADVTGREILRSYPEIKNNIISVAELPDGIYILRLNVNGQWVSKKIIKQ